MKHTLLSLLIGGLFTIATGTAVALDPADAAANVGTKAATKASISVEQRAALAEKFARIDAIMRAAQADGVTPLTLEKAQWMRESLYKLPLDQIKAIQPSGSTQTTTDAIVRAAKANTKALGSPSTDLVYRPWAPCRYIDTRNVGGKITGARLYDTFDAGNVYGGAAACDPKTLAGVADENDIAAFALNVTVVDTSTAASPGYMTMRPPGSTALSALVNWTTSSAGFQLGNAAVISVDQTALGNELEIFTSGAVHAIVDLSGAFVAPAATALACQDVVNTGTIPANGTLFLTSAACPAGYTRTSGGQCQHGGVYDQVWLSKTGNKTTGGPTDSGTGAAACAYHNVTATSYSAWINITCCRIPGL
jgi:hypothetical protein